MSARRLAPVVLLLALGLGLQLRFFARHPQPVLFGDPAGYFQVGERLQAAVSAVAAGGSAREAFESVRGTFYLLGVGTLFAAVDAVRPDDQAFFRQVLAVFNTLAMLGAFLLGRDLSRSFAGGLVALALASVYPAFSVQTGRLYPDPVTGCLLVWAGWLYLKAVRTGSVRAVVTAALLLDLALLVRSQLAVVMLLVLGAVLLASSPLWWRKPAPRRLALAFALSLVPLGVAWLGIAKAVGDRDDVLRLGNSTFQVSYPMGFWQFMHIGGWPGPYRFKTEPFYRDLEEAGREDPELMRSRLRQVAFTVRYVAERPGRAVLTVLNNAYRLYDRPANDYKWDYPFDYELQVVYQRAVCVLALAGLALFVAETPAAAGVFLLPLALLALHGMMFSWPRYHVPVMPILIASAGACLARLGPGWRVLDRRHVALAVAGLVLAGAGLLLPLPAPEVARGARLAGALALLALPFAAVPRLVPTRLGRRLAGAAFALLVALVVAHAWTDRLWHERRIELGGPVRGVEQRLTIGAAALERLRAAREAFVAFDLRVPAGDLSGTRIRVGDRAYEGTRLRPTMPRLPESTSTGGRDWRGYPQWWVLPLDRDLLPASPGTPLPVRIEVEGGPRLVLGADRFRGQGRVHEGPSFGEWPNTVALKLEYDGDHRIPVRLPLSSEASSAQVLGRDGRWRPLREAARIRLVTLGNDVGGTSWVSAPAAGEKAALGFFATSGVRQEAELLLGGRKVATLALGAAGDHETTTGPWRLCHRAGPPRGGDAYGGYVLTGPVPEPGKGVPLEVRFSTGFEWRRAFFVVDRRPGEAELAPLFEACGVPAGEERVRGVAEVTSADRNHFPAETGWWTVEEVF